MSSGVIDEAVYRLDKAFQMFSIFSVLISALPIVVFFDEINLVDEGSDLEIIEHFSLISFSYFAIFEVLIHGDTP